MRLLLRIIKFAFQHFFRNFWLSLVTVSMLTLTFLTVDVLLGLNLATDAAINNVEKRVDVSVTFKIGTEEAEVKNAASYLRSLPEVEDVGLVTPDEALIDFKTKHANNPTVLASLDEVGGNPFGYELIVRARSADNYPMILEALDHPSFRDFIEVKDFTSHETVLASLSDVTTKARWFGFTLLAIFLAIAVLIVFNTVRVTIFVHREEISIMRLVGAAGWFIRAPYLVEAFIFSLTALIISGLVVVPAVLIFNPLFDAYFETSSQLQNFFVGQAPWVFGLEFIGAALVCMASTAFAMRRYLKV
ncbi:MAG: permease-like cell division protein FtsX [Candidatus Uhrbacteria bacterium]